MPLENPVFKGRFQERVNVSFGKIFTLLLLEIASNIRILTKKHTQKRFE